MSKNNLIYHLSYEDISNKEILYNHIYSNDSLNYYVADDFSPQFYIYLASCGFVTTSITIDENFYLLPEMQFEYAILDFDDLIISKSVKKLINKNNYILQINKNPQLILDKLQEYHENNWLKSKYRDLTIKLINNTFDKNFKMLSIELYDKETDEIVAGEIGYKIGSTYTSLTGFSSKEKKYKNWGKLQLVLLALYLKDNNFSFWNLGHPYMQYKFDLGAKEYSRLDFLKRWLSNI